MVSVVSNSISGSCSVVGISPGVFHPGGVGIGVVVLAPVVSGRVVSTGRVLISGSVTLV